MLNGDNIPGQSTITHFCSSRSAPEQPLPPCAGSGLLHLRVRYLVPSPQSTEHAEKILHGLKPPLTKGKKYLKVTA